jgi:hypothetical protein
MRLRSLVAVASLVALATPGATQVCAPILPSGQPVLAPFVPVCVGVLPPPVVWAVGNPGFTLSSFAPPPVPPGLPTFLVLGLATPPAPIPAPPLDVAYGAPGLLTNGITILLPAGLSGVAPGPPIAIPIPPTGGPVPLLSVHTAVVAPPVPALTGATGISI